jgi:hypothetical protein
MRWAVGLIVAASVWALPAWGSQPVRPEVLESRGYFGSGPEGGPRTLTVLSQRVEWWPAELPGTTRRVRAVVSRFVPGAARVTHAIRIEEHYFEAEPRGYYGVEDGAGLVAELSAHRLDTGECAAPCGLRRHLEVYEVALPAAAAAAGGGGGLLPALPGQAR